MNSRAGLARLLRFNVKSTLPIATFYQPHVGAGHPAASGEDQIWGSLPFAHPIWNWLSYNSPPLRTPLEMYVDNNMSIRNFALHLLDLRKRPSSTALSSHLDSLFYIDLSADLRCRGLFPERPPTFGLHQLSAYPPNPAQWAKQSTFDGSIPFLTHCYLTRPILLASSPISLESYKMSVASEQGNLLRPTTTGINL